VSVVAITSVEASAVAAAVGFVVVAIFQAALALGAPFGRAAWGGRRARLPGGLRVASGIAIVVWLAAAVIVLGRAGIEVVALSRVVLRWGAWALVVILALGALMNLASRSPLERWIWGPVTVVLAILTFIVARGGG
jgi:hypothetical protein